MPDAAWFRTAARGGYVVGEPNMSETMPSRLQPGCDCALHQYADTGRIWLWIRDEGETRWRPERVATPEQIEWFRRAGKLRE